MKEWIRNLNGQDIKEACNALSMHYRTPEDLDKKILKKIREKVKWSSNKHKKPSVIKGVLVAAAIAVLFIISLIFFLLLL